MMKELIQGAFSNEVVIFKKIKSFILDLCSVLNIIFYLIKFSPLNLLLPTAENNL